jgi:predicted DNA-binding transcriptional regulator YafY
LNCYCGKEIKILYTNWKGQIAIRTIIPKEIIFTSNEYPKEEQWCLVVFDVDKQAYRTFACKDIKKWFLD